MPLVEAEEQLAEPKIITPAGDRLPFTPARWWKATTNGRVECALCPRSCRVADRERGACGVRENRDGRYYTLVHSRACSLHLDPIEKKPFYHLLPGTQALSLAAPGCNIECKFCQNWQIAQVRPEQLHTTHLAPKELVRLARRRGAPSIACTYTEPVVWAEYVDDIAVAAKTAGLRTLLVSNAYIQSEALAELLPHLGAIKVDLKAMRERFYRESCAGSLQEVLDALRQIHKAGCWLEIVMLVIPTLNDSREELRDLARFVRDELSPEVPVHFTRFHPAYRLQNLPRTPITTLELAREIALGEGLHYAYIGNVPGHPGNHTYCPSCGELLIRRLGLALAEMRLINGACPICSHAIPGLWR